MVIQYKCPDCGADMAFDSSTGRLRCGACGREEQIDGYSAQDFESFEERSHSSSFSGDDVSQYKCANCGAAIFTDKNTTATECSFCGSPMILGDRLSGSLAPSKVIPFRISREEAEKTFKKWCGHGLLMPKKFKPAERIKSLTGMYVPFWLYDLRGQGEAMARCTRTYTRDEEDYIVSETRHYDVYRKIDLSYSSIPADASEKMPDGLMDRLEPYDYAAMKDFNARYLAGFISEKYSYTDREMFPRAKKRAEKHMDDFVYESIRGYDSKTIVSRDYRVGQVGAEYALLPVWMVCCDYENSEYMFAMNGQTGKVAGSPPVSKPKAAAAAAAVAGCLFAVCRLITFLMGGPLL